VAGARHRGTPSREAAEHEGAEHGAAEQGAREGGAAAPSREGGRSETPPCRAEQGGRRRRHVKLSREAGPKRRAGREGGRRCRHAEPSREAGPPEGPEGTVGWWLRLATQHRDTGGQRRTGGVGRVADAGGRQAAAGAGKAPRRSSGGRQRPTGVRREAAEHEQGAGRHGARLAAGSNSSAAPVGAGVRRWAKKTTINSFSPNLRVGHDPPCRSAPACIVPGRRLPPDPSCAAPPRALHQPAANHSQPPRAPDSRHLRVHEPGRSSYLCSLSAVASGCPWALAWLLIESLSAVATTLILA
jgi:hypothetical protein